MNLLSLFVVMIVLCSVLPFISSVVSMGAFLLSSALCCTLVLSLLLGSWFGFILFLIYITGLLVLFGYMLAMSPNAFMSSMTKAKGVLLAGTVVFGCALGLGVYCGLSPLVASSGYESTVVGLYSNYSLVMYWFVGLILFLALVMVVVLCYKAPKPLRAFLK